MDSSYYGFDIPVKNGKDYYIKILLYNIAVASSEEGNIDINFQSKRWHTFYFLIYVFIEVPLLNEKWNELF